VGLILIPLYTGHFNVESYGMLGILEISSQILVSVLGFGLFNAYFRWYWDKQYAGMQKKLLFTIVVFMLFQIILFFILILSLKKYFSLLLFDNETYTYLIQLMLYVGSLEALGVIISTLLRIKERAVFYTIAQVARLIVTLVVTVYLVKYKGKNIEAVYEAQLLANAVYFLIILKTLLNNIEWKFEWKVLREMLSFSLPLVLTTVSGIILNITDRYALRFLADLNTVGIYTLGYKVANTIRIVIVTSVNFALQPIIFRMMNDPMNKRFYSKVMTYYTFGLMFFVLFFALFASEIIKLISLNPEYWAAYTIVPALSFSMLFGMLRDVAYTSLNLMKKTRIIAVIVICISLINIGLNIIFIPLWGFYGAAYATLLSNILFFAVVYACSQKYYFIPYELKKVILMIFTGFVIYLLSLLTTELNLFLRIPLKLLLILMFPIILYVLGFYEKVEITHIKNFWIKWRDPTNWKKNLNNLKIK